MRACHLVPCRLCLDRKRRFIQVRQASLLPINGSELIHNFFKSFLYQDQRGLVNAAGVK